MDEYRIKEKVVQIRENYLKREIKLNIFKTFLLIILLIFVFFIFVFYFSNFLKGETFSPPLPPENIEEEPGGLEEMPPLPSENI
ncbi:MAG: hypothetical protein QW678_01775 [Candidatus Aenigmatarchaeota archaeon]